MNKGILPEKDDTKINQQTLCQDDFIEWVLQNTNEETEFRVHQTKHYTVVGIDVDEVKDDDV